MSQAGQISVSGEPSVPIEFVTNSGTAVPLGNSLNILGSAGITTSGSGDTVTISLGTEPFTAGSVIFAGSGGDFSQDNTNFFYDSTAHKLKLTAFELTTGASSGYVLVSDVSGNGSWSAISSVGVSSITGTANEVLVNSTTGSPQIGAITLTLPQQIATSSSPTFAGLNLSGLTASQAVVTDGSNNLVSLAYASLAGSPAGGTNNLASRDTNGNTAFNNVFADVTGNAAAGTITLTVASSGVQTFSSGSGSATVVLPVASTLIVGWSYQFNNNASGSITVQTADASNLVVMPSGSYIKLICTSNSGTAGQWDYHWLMPSSARYGTAGLTVTGTITGTTSVSSPQLLLTGSSSGTISILPQAAAGTYNFNMPTTAGTSGYVLTSAGGGSSPMTWTNLGSATVTSISGTANQISASASTGAVTLSFTNGISIGSYQSNSPPTGGIIAPGQVSFGTSSPSAGQLTINSTLDYGIVLQGSPTAQDGSSNQFGLQVLQTYQPAASAGNLNGLEINPAFITAISNTTTYASCIHTYPRVSTNAGTITQLAGIFCDVGTSGAGTISYSYGGLFKTPTATGGLATIALYADNAAIGTATTPPTNGMFVSGQTAIGTTTPIGLLTVNGTLTVSGSADLPTTTNTTLNIASGFGTPVIGRVYIGDGSGWQLNFAKRNSSVTTDLITMTDAGYLGIKDMAPAAYLSIVGNAQIGGTTGTTAPTNGLYVAGAIQNANLTASEVVATDSSKNLVSISNSTSGYVLTSNGAGSIPTFQAVVTGVTSIAGTTNQIAASASTGAVTLSFTNGISIGSYQAISPPTGGIIVPGIVGIGTSGPANGSQLEVSSVKPYNINITGTQIALDGSNDQLAIRLVSIFTPTSGSSGSFAIGNEATFIAPTGQTISNAYGYYAAINLGANVGTITSAFGVYSANSSITGTVTNSYSGYFVNPAGGTNKIALYADNLAIGTTGTAPPANGLLVNGTIQNSALTAIQIVATDSSKNLVSIASSTSGYVLASNGSGSVPSFQSLSSLSVTSISGTANQIAASASTGAVTLSLTNGISLGSYQSTSSPTGGILAPGQVSIGTSTPSSGLLTVNSTLDYGIVIEGSTSAQDGSGDQFGLQNVQVYQPTNSAGYTNAIELTPTFIAASTKTTTYATGEHIYITTSSNVGTITQLAGLWVDTGSSGAGTISYSYGGLFKTPAATGGTATIALYSDNAAIGTATTPPTNGMFVSGQTAIGTTTPIGLLTVNGTLTVSGSTDIPVNTNTLLNMASGFGSPVLGRIYIGDGTGWKLNFAKRNSSVTTDLMTMYDHGYLGINDTAPAAYLSIVGNAQIGGTTGTTAPTNGLYVAGAIQNANLTAIEVVATDSSKNLVSISNGTSGYVLTSNGAGSAPTFQVNTSSSPTITGDTGGALGPATGYTFSGGTTGLSFGGSGTTETLTFAGITANGGTVNLGTDNASNGINIGVGTVARTIIIGNSSPAHIIQIGNSTGPTSTTIQGNITMIASGTQTTAIGNSTGPSTTTILGTVNIITSSAVQTLSIGNNSAPTTTTILGTVNIDTSGSNTTTIGASGTTLTMNAGTINMGVSGTTTNTILGATNINTTGTDQTSIGNSASTTLLTGVIDINTSGSATTTIGNANATTNVVGITNINTGTSTAETDIGNNTNGTVVKIIGGTGGGVGTGYVAINNSVTTPYTYIGSGNSGIVNMQGANIYINNGAAGTTTIGNASATAVNLLGPVNINTTGSITTSIGNSSSTTALVGPVNVNTTGSGTTTIGGSSSTTDIVGATNVNTGTSTALTTIGNNTSGTIVVINGGTGGGVGTGYVSINNSITTPYTYIGSASSGFVSIYAGTLSLNPTGSGAANINTGGTGAVTIGNTTGNTVITGSLGINATISSLAQTHITTANAYALLIDGTLTAVDSGPNQIGINNSPIFSKAGSSTTQVSGYAGYPSFIAATAQTMGSAFGIYNSNTLNSNVGTVNQAAGLYIDTGTSKSGTLNYSYGAFINKPAATGAVLTISLYAADAAIGTVAAPPANGLIVGGNIQAAGLGSGTGTALILTAGNLIQALASSRRYKENIRPVGDYSNSFEKLNPVLFNYINDPENITDAGFIAEEVAEIMPELVVYKNEEPESIRYHCLHAILVNELQKALKRIEILEGKI